MKTKVNIDCYMILRSIIKILMRVNCFISEQIYSEYNIHFETKLGNNGCNKYTNIQIVKFARTDKRDFIRKRSKMTEII